MAQRSWFGDSEHRPLYRARRPPIRDFVAAALARDFREATELTLEFLTSSRSPVAVITDLFQAAQQYTADRWHVGDATAQDEYRVCEAIESSMGVLPRMPEPGMGSKQPAVLLATLWPEEHDLGLRLVAMALEDAGWVVDHALRDFSATLLARVAQRRYSLVGISATYLSARSRIELSAIVTELHRLGKRVIAGGQAFSRVPLLGDQIGVDAVADDPRLATMLARRLIGVNSRHLGAPQRRYAMTG